METILVDRDPVDSSCLAEVQQDRVVHELDSQWDTLLREDDAYQVEEPFLGVPFQEVPFLVATFLEVPFLEVPFPEVPFLEVEPSPGVPFQGEAPFLAEPYREGKPCQEEEASFPEVPFLEEPFREVVPSPGEPFRVVETFLGDHLHIVVACYLANLQEVGHQVEEDPTWSRSIDAGFRWCCLVGCPLRKYCALVPLVCWFVCPFGSWILTW